MYCKNCGTALNENQAVCLNCGVLAGTGKSYCHNCGSAVSSEAVICVNCGVFLNNNAQNANNTNTANTATNNANAQNIREIAPRSIITALLLSIITCGIYGIYWFVALTNETNKASGRINDTNGGTAFLLSLVTCGIYSWIWLYKLGEKRDIIANEKGSSNILYLILGLFGLGIIPYCLAQDALNKAIERTK